MKKSYGEKKGKKVYYAMERMGKMKGMAKMRGMESVKRPKQ
jgi:hypothetical protein